MKRVQKQKPRNLCIKSKKDWNKEERSESKPKKTVAYKRKTKYNQWDEYDDYLD